MWDEVGQCSLLGARLLVPSSHSFFTLMQGKFLCSSGSSCKLVVWGGGVERERMGVAWESVESDPHSLDGAVVSPWVLPPPVAQGE